MQQIDNIVDNIDKWSQVRNTNLGLNFLTGGYGIVVTRQNYNAWKNNTKEGTPPEHIHMYLGISEMSLLFYLVDSNADTGIASDYKVGENLFVKSFFKNRLESASPQIDLNHIKVNIDPHNSSDLLNRIFKWFFYSNVWFTQKISEAIETDAGGIVRAFQIPFDNLTTLFNSTDNPDATVLLFFGIDNKLDTGHAEIDMILSLQEDTEVSLINFKDLTRPCPPFSSSSFKLFSLQTNNQLAFS